MGRSRGGLTTKVHALVDARGLPIRMVLTAGQVHDSQAVPALLDGLTADTVVVADKGYDADWIRAMIEPPRVSRRLLGLSHAAMAGCSSIA